MGAERLGLGQDSVHLLKAEALLVAVFRRPAAGAVHVAGGGRVHQNEPRHVDVVFSCVFLRRLVAAEAALIGRVRQEGLENVGVVFADDALGIARPFSVGVFRDHAQRLIGLVAPRTLVDLLDHVDELLGKVAHVLRLAFFSIDSRIVSNALRSAAWEIFR